jgi:3-oxoacyl-[acyl-carrier-protein] synthase II
MNDVMEDQDIVFTGMGLVLPCGDGINAARASLESKQPCFKTMPEQLGPGRGAICDAFNPVGIIPPMQLRRLDRCSRFAWAAAHHAILDAKLDTRAKGEQVAVSLGTMTAGSEASEVFMRPYFEKGPEGASPMVFTNCVANAATGYLAIALGIKGLSSSQLERENAIFAALDQAARWLRLGMAEAAVVIGVDGLFPFLFDVLRGARLSKRHGDPIFGSGEGFLPGEGAQAFVIETRQHAFDRGAQIRATLCGLKSMAPIAENETARIEAMKEAIEVVAAKISEPTRIGGGNGHRRIDALEQAIEKMHPEWPKAFHPKLLWGEFCGSGGQLLAAAMLQNTGPVLVTSPGSFGPQYAALIERH